MMCQMNSEKVVDDNAHWDMPGDWKKETMEELVRLVPKRNLLTIDLVALLIHGVSKSPFAY